jgi:hypothetical protein
VTAVGRPGLSILEIQDSVFSNIDAHKILECHGQLILNRGPVREGRIMCRKFTYTSVAFVAGDANALVDGDKDWPYAS